MAGRLTVVRVTTHGDGVTTRYFVDDRLGELRAVDNPHSRILQYDLLLGTLAGLVTVEREGEEGGD